MYVIYIESSNYQVIKYQLFANFSENIFVDLFIWKFNLSRRLKIHESTVIDLYEELITPIQISGLEGKYMVANCAVKILIIHVY